MFDVFHRVHHLHLGGGTGTGEQLVITRVVALFFSAGQVKSSGNAVRITLHGSTTLYHRMIIGGLLAS